jgi:Spy/CpxP family protein refolding chaperone
MRTGLYRYFTTIVLTVLFAGGAGWIGAKYAVSHHEAGSALHDIVHASLNLNTDQEQRLDIIEQKYAEQRKAKEADVRAANRELASAIQAGHQDTPEVEAAIDHIHMAMGALQKATVMHVFDMRAVLTPEQAKKFDAKVAAALTDTSR